MSAREWRRWFAPRRRALGSWAFALNRFSGLLLAAYLLVHLGVLSLLRRQSDSYDAFVHAVSSPPALVADLLLVAVALGHGLNGVRLIALGLGARPERQKLWFWGLMAVGVLLFAYAGYRMLGPVMAAGVSG
ncbi:MAG: hypothetical protein QJR14_09920 [Bacillota bacterium]|nr:hypothetical protein [Bacillota bacterium]